MRLAAMKTTSLSMCSVLPPCGGGFGCGALGCGFCDQTPAEEQIGAQDLHSGGDAALHPVLDALGSAGCLVEAKGLGQFGRSTERLDQLGVGVEGVGDVHDPKLNVTFKQKSNAAFNNAMFSLGRIPRMSDSLMHPSMARLYQAARELKDVVGQSAVGRLLNASPQTIKNWETRGVSKAGAITAQEIVGCSATWVLEGTGPMAAVLLDQGPISRTPSCIPVVGMAKLGDNGFYEEISSAPGNGDGTVEAYSTDPGAYALRVRGDSMFPAIRDGWYVVVEPHGRRTTGEYVLIKLVNGQKMVKELIMERPESITVVSVNGDKRRTIMREEIDTHYGIQPVSAILSPSKWRPD